ncbi:hypothetical protein EMIT0P258_190043 [Pseudomonas sp. IT-P258]
MPECAVRCPLSAVRCPFEVALTCADFYECSPHPRLNGESLLGSMPNTFRIYLVNEP